jgi:hypothetical protein
MTLGELSTIIFAASGALATGVFFVVVGLSHNFYLASGAGILSFCAVFYFICESKSIKAEWEELKIREGGF